MGIRLLLKHGWEIREVARCSSPNYQTNFGRDLSRCYRRVVHATASCMVDFLWFEEYHSWEPGCKCHSIPALIISHMLHGAGILPTFARTRSPSFVGKCTSTTEHMGMDLDQSHCQPSFFPSIRICDEKWMDLLKAEDIQETIHGFKMISIKTSNIWGFHISSHDSMALILL